MEKKNLDVDMVKIDNNDLITRAGTENKIKTPFKWYMRQGTIQISQTNPKSQAAALGNRLGVALRPYTLDSGTISLT